MIGLVKTVENLVVNTMASILILLTVVAGLAGAERIAERFRDWKRERRREALLEAGLSKENLEKLTPLINYEIKYYSRFKPVLGLLAAASLILLAMRSSNTTGLVFSYGAMAFVFGVLTLIETIRLLRARRIHRYLKFNPNDLVSNENPYEVFKFVSPEEINDFDSEVDER
jgi:Flp pilus assembly protein TadB